MTQTNPFNLSLAFETSITPMLVIQGTVIKKANSVANQLVLRDLAGETLSDFLHPQSQWWIRELNTLRHLNPPTEVRLNTQNPNADWVEIAIAPIEWDGQRGYLATLINITQRKRLNEHSLQYEPDAVFEERLKSLHTISIRLSHAATFDDLCREAVEFGRTELGFDRLGLWFLDPNDPYHLRGSFGTGENGEIRDERSKSIEFTTSNFPTIPLTSEQIRIYYNENAPLYNDAHQVIGQGWIAMSYLQDGEKVIGQISTDNFINRQPLERYNLELLALYAAMIGHLCVRKRMEENLRQNEADALKFQEYLKLLHNISIQLSKAQSFDELCRRAVELGRQSLGFDRLSLWFEDKSEQIYRGTFGTDENGNTRDEHNQFVEFNANYPTIQLQGENRLFLSEDATLFNDRKEVVGKGWIAIAYLPDIDDTMGLICADNLIRHMPLERYQLEILALYATTIGNLCVRQRAEQNLRQNEENARIFQERLKSLHQVSIELAKVDTVDSLCRYAIELGHNELQFERLSLWLLEAQPNHYAGTFGIDEAGNLRAEYSQRLTFSPEDFPMVELADGDLRVFLKENSPLTDDKHNIVGYGSIAMSYLKDGEQVIGLMFADTLFSQKALPRHQLELMALYTNTLANLITRKRTEDQLRAAEERFSKAFHASPLSITIGSSREGYTDVNDKFLELIGYTREEVLGKTAGDLNMWESQSEYKRIKDESLKYKGFPAQEVRIRNKHGEIKTIIMATEIIEMRQEQYFLTISHDITERKKIEQMALDGERLKIALVKEQELSDIKTNMIVRISHEFRTPLTILLNSAQILDRYYDRLEEERRHYHLSLMQDYVYQMTEMVEDILLTARGMFNHLEYDPQPFDLVMDCQYIIQEFQNRLRAGQIIRTDIQGIVDTFIGDKQLIRLLFENLLSNAIKFSLRAMPIDVLIQANTAGIIIRIKDEGIGIPDNDKDRIFEPFFRASNVGEIRGMGIGLRLAKEVVALHQGSITFDSYVERGTTFSVYLPFINNLNNTSN